MKRRRPSDYDEGEGADNVDDDDSGEALSVLDDDINDGVEEELRAVIDDLGEDQQADARLLLGRPGHLRGVGLGRGDGRGDRRGRSGGVVDQFLEMPMLASVLEAGMAAFELSCDGVGDVS
jgi:hypothetical protein